MSATRLLEFLTPRLWLGWAVGVALWLAWLISVMTGGGMYDRFGQLVCTDHLAFYSAARMIREGRAAEIYDLPTIAFVQVELVGERWHGKYEAYRNPPFYALLYALTAKWDYTASAYFWFGVSALATALSVWLLIGHRDTRLMAWAFTFPPTFFALSYGQNTSLSLVVFCVAYRLLNANHRFAAGAVIGLLSFKPTLLIGLSVWVLFDIKRLWPCVLGLLFSVSVLCGVSYLIIPEAWKGFTDSLLSNANFDQMDWWKNLTPRSFWRLLVGANQLSLMLWAMTAIHAVAVAWFVIRRLHDHARKTAILFALAIPLTLWLSPHALVYEWQLFLLPALLLPVAVPAIRERWPLVCAGFFMLTLVGPPLSQWQVKYLPYAFHLVVPASGWIVWIVMKWVTRPGSPLEGNVSASDN